MPNQLTCLPVHIICYIYNFIVSPLQAKRHATYEELMEEQAEYEISRANLIDPNRMDDRFVIKGRRVRVCVCVYGGSGQFLDMGS